MDKGWGPPPTLHDLQMEGLPPPPTLHDLQMDKSWGPCNPSRLGNGLQMDKWTRVGGSPTPICKWTRVGLHDSPPPPDPSGLANGQGLGAPTLHDLQMDKGWGPPNPSRLANGQRRPGAPPQIELSLTGPFGSDCTFPSANLKFCLDKDSRPAIDKSMTGPFGPEGTPTQTLNFVCIEHISKGTRSPSTE